MLTAVSIWTFKQVWIYPDSPTPTLTHESLSPPILPATSTDKEAVAPPLHIFLTVLPIQRRRRLTRLIVPAGHSATCLLLTAFHHLGDRIDERRNRGIFLV